MTESPEIVKNFVLKLGRKLEATPLLSLQTLTITFNDEKKEDKPEPIEPPEEVQNEILIDFAQMFQNQSYTDVTFEIDGKTVGAHKSVLSCKKKFNSFHQ